MGSSPDGRGLTGKSSLRWSTFSTSDLCFLWGCHLGGRTWASSAAAASARLTPVLVAMSLVGGVSKQANG